MVAAVVVVAVAVAVGVVVVVVVAVAVFVAVGVSAVADTAPSTDIDCSIVETTAAVADLNCFGFAAGIATFVTVAVINRMKVVARNVVVVAAAVVRQR